SVYLTIGDRHEKPLTNVSASRPPIRDAGRVELRAFAPLAERRRQSILFRQSIVQFLRSAGPGPAPAFRHLPQKRRLESASGSVKPLPGRFLDRPARGLPLLQSRRGRRRSLSWKPP